MKITYMNYKILKNSIVSLVIISLFFCANLALASSPVYSGLDIAVKGTNLASDPIKMIGSIVVVLLGMLGLVLVLIILYAGALWGFMSNGDPAKIKKAKEMIINAVIGLFIIFTSYMITTFTLDRIKDMNSGTSGGSVTGDNTIDG